MRKNLASAIVLGASMALSISAVSSTFAAGYPTVVATGAQDKTGTVVVGTVKPGTPVLKNVVVNTAVGTVKLPIVVTTSVAKPAELTIPGFTTGKKVTSTAVGPGGVKLTLPTLVVGAGGKLDTKVLGFTKPGTYTITYKQGNVTKTVKINIKK